MTIETQLCGLNYRRFYGERKQDKKKPPISIIRILHISKHFNLASFIALHCVDLAKLASDTQDWGFLPQGAKTGSGGIHSFIYLFTILFKHLY